MVSGNELRPQSLIRTRIYAVVLGLIVFRTGVPVAQRPKENISSARHPNLVALEVSSFKCGHDAPIYGVIEGIIEESGTPYFSFKDLDENKPSGSIRIRVETIDYFLRRYREDIIHRRKAEADIEAKLAEFALQLESERLASV